MGLFVFVIEFNFKPNVEMQA